MILLPALVFMLIHLGNNDWKFKISDADENDEPNTIEDIFIPSVTNCNGEFLFSENVGSKFGGDYKKVEVIDGVK